MELEITENLLMAEPRAPEILSELRSRGCVAVDDFGTGYSSLAYLKDLPITALKIDRGFVHGVPDSPKYASITRAIIGIARHLGFDAVPKAWKRRATPTSSARWAVPHTRASASPPQCPPTRRSTSFPPPLATNSIGPWPDRFLRCGKAADRSTRSGVRKLYRQRATELRPRCSNRLRRRALLAFRRSAG